MLYGKTGLCLFYYISSRVDGNKQYAEYADSLLEDIYEKMPTTNVRFDNGLIGIGCAIEYLVQHGYVIGNTDEILQEIDVQLLKQLVNDDNLRNLNLANGCAGYLCYLIFRLQGRTSSRKNDPFRKLLKEMVFYLINSIEKNLLLNFVSINRDVSFDLFASFPLTIKLLRKSYDLGIYNQKILRIIEQVLGCLDTMLPTLNTNRLYLVAVLLEFSNIVKSKQFEKSINFLLCSVDYDNVINEIPEYNCELQKGIAGVKYLLWDLLRKLPAESGYNSNIKNLYNAVNKQHLSLSIDDPLSIDKVGICDGVIGVKLVDYLIEGKIQ